jgi:hypothetical protein
MAGLLVLGIAVMWLLFAAKMGRVAAGAFPRHWMSSFFGLAAFATIAVLPFADEIVGEWQFRRLCTSEAVVWVHPNATNVIAARATPATRDLGGFVFPIREQVSEYVEATTGEPFLRVKALHTPGGFIMRAGLNMGSSRSCWPARWSEHYRDLKLDELLKRGKT